MQESYQAVETNPRQGTLLSKAMGSVGLTIFGKRARSTTTRQFPTAPKEQKLLFASCAFQPNEALLLDEEDSEQHSEVEDTMKVKELKNWLSDFGEKNKDHYNRGRMRPSFHRRKKKNKKDKKGTKTATNEPTKKDDNLMEIQAKPSDAPTSPTSSVGINSPRSEGATNVEIAPSLSVESSPGGHLDLDLNLPDTNHSPMVEYVINPVEDQVEPVKEVSIEPVTVATTKTTLDDWETMNDHKVSAEPNGSFENDATTNNNDSVKLNPSLEPTAATFESEWSDEIGNIPTDSWETEEASDPWLSTDDTNVNKKDQEEDASGTFAESLPGSENSSTSTPDNKVTPPVRKSTFEGVEGMSHMGHDHFALLRKQKPTSLTQANAPEEQVDGEVAFCNEEKKDDASKNMHNANIFGNRTLTSPTLDFICDGKVDESKYEIKNTISSSSSEGASGSEWSEDSKQPSISADALDSKMARSIFGDEKSPDVKNSDPKSCNAGDSLSFFETQLKSLPSVGEEEVAVTSASDSSDKDEPRLVNPPVTRKLRNPEDLAFLRPKEVKPTLAPSAEEPVTNADNPIQPSPSFESECPSFAESCDTEVYPQEILKAKKRNSRLSADDLPFLKSKEVIKPAVNVYPEPKTGPVADRVQKFGGKSGRKSRVSQRKESLEKLWAENKEVKHVTKIKWGICPKTGVYKKIAILEIQDK